MSRRHTPTAARFVVDAKAIAEMLQERNPGFAPEHAVILTRSMVEVFEREAAPLLPHVVVEVIPPGALALEGDGLGDILSPEQGRQALRAHATDLPPERWAGEVAKPTELAKRLGISRATLDNWRRDGVVLALPKGLRSHVYPVAQFDADGVPLKGLREVLALTDGKAGVAWRWLVTPHVDFNSERPLNALNRGEVVDVENAAQRDFG